MMEVDGRSLTVVEFAGRMHLIGRPVRRRQRRTEDEGVEFDHGRGLASVGNKRARVAASSKAILGLQEVRAGDAAQTECAVCLQDFCAEETLRAMPCSHAFHQHCIFAWLRRNGVCPLCRHQLPTEQEEEIGYQAISSRACPCQRTR